MPHQSDNPDQQSRPPHPDLNPLLNPILAKNIGRWADVYFTNPPEKRDEAVQHLVRELESASPLPEGAVAPPSPQLNGVESKNTPTAQNAGVPVRGITCLACGYVNRRQHKFCGSCGEPLSVPTAVATAKAKPQAVFPAWPWRAKGAPRWPWHRAYAGVALALAVSLLAYMAWHAQSLSGASRAVRQASNAIADSSSPKPVVVAQTSPVSASPPIPVFVSVAAVGNSDGTAPATGGGFDELAVARDYLDGTNGKEQNHPEALVWLWKAVAKRNVAATMLLADMFLRGDAVPKNCEQARLLLDVAATKGRKDAAEELRNLQAFGCE